MQGYASIGATYLLREQNSDNYLIWAVIENNSNDKTSTLLCLEAGPENGKKVIVDGKWLYEREPIGPIFSTSGEIVNENGIEFIRPVEKKEQCTDSEEQKLIYQQKNN